MPPPRIKLDTWIRELILRSGLSQKTVADALGVSVDEVGEWETNQKKPTRDTLLAIALLLGSGEDDASTLLEMAGYNPLTDADRATMSRIEAQPSFAAI